VARQRWHRCIHCGKLAYNDRTSAKAASKRLKVEKMQPHLQRVYECPTQPGYYHLTTRRVYQ
jgi:hypothetical protein